MYFRKQSKFAQPSSFCGINALFLFIVALFIHYLDIINNSLYYKFLFVALFLSLLSIIFAILTIVDLWRCGYKGGLKALKAIFYALLTILPIAYGYFIFCIKPAINDVSTDINNPPAFLQNCTTALKAPPIILSKAKANRYDITLEEMLNAIRNIAQSRNWQIIQETNDIKYNKTYYIELTRKTWMGGFSSNLVVRLHKEDHSIFVDARAHSCNLRSDGGLSDNFINKFMQFLDKMLIIGDIN